MDFLLPTGAAMNWFRNKLQEWRRARAAITFVRDFHVADRARLQRLASEGRFDEIRRDNAALFGAEGGQRARLVSVRGVQL